VHPEPSLWLQIGTDPTGWLLRDADEATAARELTRATGPVALSVDAPIRGQLVLSPRRAGALSLYGPPLGDGLHPTGVFFGLHPTGFGGGGPVLYLPSVTGVSRDWPGYALDTDTDLAALERDILIAMTDGARLSLRISALSGLKLLVVDGAALAFAVLGQATA
jgi:hypothetical protein